MRHIPIPSGLAILLLAASAALPAVDQSQPSGKPNILFAVADDWSFGHAGAYGCRWVKTPGLDRVAQQGILFTQAYTPIGKCSPSRAAIITGRNPWQLKEAVNHWAVFPPEFKTFQEALADNGYFVGMTGKGWGPGIAQDQKGGNREMTGRPYAARSLPVKLTKGIARDDYAGNFNDFLDASPKGQPWSFWYGGHEPHRGYEFGSGVAKGGKKLTDIDRVPSCWPDTEDVRHDMLDYAYEVEHFDHHLVLMLDELEKRGLLENTLVIVTSDNGMPFPHDKGYAYNDSNHLPLAIMWPKGIAHPGRVVGDYVSFIDFAPTFLDVAGIDPVKSGMAACTGRSLTEIFTSEKSGQVVPGRDHVLVGKERTDIGRPHDEGYPIRGIVKGGMLYLHNFEPDRLAGGAAETGFKDSDDGPTKSAVLATRNSPDQRHFFETSFGKQPADQLFDLRQDPDCVANLAERIPFVELQKQLFDELRQQEDPRMLGQGSVIEGYPYGSVEKRRYYERTLQGEKIDSKKEE